MIFKKKLLVFLLMILVVALLAYLFFSFCMEAFRPPKKDLFLVLEDFCDKNCGDDWIIDSIQHYNPKIVFVIVQTRQGKLDLSVQPDIGAIIVEDTQIPGWKKRVFRY